MSDETTVPETPQASPKNEEYDDLEQLEEEMESENEGLDTKGILKIVLFIAVAAVILVIILGIFGFLSQNAYGP